VAPPLWFIAALIPMVASQLVRLHLADPATWIFWDYAGRIGALAVLVAVPSGRLVAFQLQRLRIAWWEAGLWIVGLVLLDQFLSRSITPRFNATFPGTVFGVYPASHGWLHVIDTIFGLALVAYNEEILFRRCARRLFQDYVGDGYEMVVVTSLLFAAYHWWAGIGVVFEAASVGVLLMLFYRRSGALWPAVLAHYLIDIVEFADLRIDQFIQAT
jgi:membrane protease YdiL (CAAX protease family)